jgi:hypothetical protein
MIFGAIRGVLTIAPLPARISSRRAKTARILGLFDVNTMPNGTRGDREARQNAFL